MVAGREGPGRRPRGHPDASAHHRDADRPARPSRPPRHSGVTSLVLCAQAGGKSLGRSRGDSRPLHQPPAQGSESSGQPPGGCWTPCAGPQALPIRQDPLHPGWVRGFLWAARCSRPGLRGAPSCEKRLPCPLTCCSGAEGFRGKEETHPWVPGNRRFG